MDSNRLKSGLTAGFAATAALSLLMVGKAMLGLAPQLNPIGDIVGVLHAVLGIELPASAGWVVHFVIGTLVWGALYGLIEPFLPGPPVVRGLAFGVLAWLAMMIVLMPVAGQGLFGLKDGAMAPLMTLALHLIYGATLGAVYASQSNGAELADVTPN